MRSARRIQCQLFMLGLIFGVVHLVKAGHQFRVATSILAHLTFPATEMPCDAGLSFPEGVLPI
jgi:hypothetical protein